MSGTLLIVIGVSLVVMVLVLTVGRGPGGRPRPPRSISGMAERENAAHTQFEIEEHDIEEMLAARNALRARIGKPPIGDELAEDVRRRPSDGSEKT
jgi:hypothetical protein